MPKQSNFTKPKILLQNGPGRLRSFASLPATTTTTEANIEIAEHRNVERMGRIGSRLVDRQLAKKCETQQQQQQQNHRRLTSDILAFDPIHRIRLPEIKRLQQFQQDKPKPMQQMKPKVSEPKSQQQMEIRILDTRMIRKQKNLILSRKLELQKQQQMLENERKKQIQLKRTLEQKKSEKFLKSRTRTIFSNVVSKFPTTTSSLASPSLSVIEVTPDSITFPLSSSSSSTNSKSLQLHDSQVLLIQFSKDDNEYHVYTKNGREFELSIDWNGDSEPTPLWIQFSVNSDLVQTFSKDGIMQQIPPPLISHPIRIHESSMRNSTEKFSEDFSSEELMICCDPSLQMEFKQEAEDDDDDDDDDEEEENQEEEQEEVEKEEQEVESWKPKRGRPRKSEIMIPIKQSSKILINERRQRTRTIK